MTGFRSLAAKLVGQADEEPTMKRTKEITIIHYRRRTVRKNRTATEWVFHVSLQY
jgi:hypothetical protein